MCDYDNAIFRLATAQEAEPGDYTGGDGLLYCGKCRQPKEAYFAEGKTLFGRDRHPKECDCKRADREKREAADREQKHREEVERLKRKGFTDPAMREWTFENDNGKCPQMDKAHFYVAHWEDMKAENIGYLLWGKVGAGKSYFAGCIANALMEKEISVCMTNFALILKHLARADCNAGNGILRNIAGNLRVFGNEFIHAVKQRAAAREANAVFRNVACKLRRSFFKKVSNRFKDILKRFFKRIDHFV